MKIYDIYNHYGYGSEFDDAHIYHQAWVQKRKAEERHRETIHELPELFSSPELGI